MAPIHLIEGPVGAGKSTFAASLSQRIGAPHINLDDWMTTLYHADRPASEVMPCYCERKERCIEQIWKLTRSLLACKVDTVRELGLIRRSLREDFYHRVDDAGYPLSVYVLDASREVRHQRVRKRNRARAATFSIGSTGRDLRAGQRHVGAAPRRGSWVPQHSADRDGGRLGAIGPPVLSVNRRWHNVSA